MKAFSAIYLAKIQIFISLISHLFISNLQMIEKKRKERNKSTRGVVKRNRNREGDCQ